jgi:hypothetical protein
VPIFLRRPRRRYRTWAQEEPHGDAAEHTDRRFMKQPVTPQICAVLPMSVPFRR